MANLNSKLLILLHTHQAAITELAAAKIVALHLKGYAGLNEAKVAARFVDPFKLLAQYLQSGEIAQWQAYITGGTLAWLGQGFPSKEMSQTAACIIEAITQVLERELPGQAYQMERENYLSRLKSVEMLTSSLIISTRLNNGLKEPIAH